MISATNAAARRCARAVPRGPLLPAQRDRARAAAARRAPRRHPAARRPSSSRASASPRRERALRGHAWPGNVRELKNALQRAALLAGDDPIDAAALTLPGRPARALDEPGSTAPRSKGRSRATAVVAQAAAELGLSRQALYRRMEKLGIRNPGPSDDSEHATTRLALAHRALASCPAGWVVLWLARRRRRALAAHCCRSAVDRRGSRRCSLRLLLVPLAGLVRRARMTARWSRTVRALTTAS